MGILVIYNEYGYSESVRPTFRASIPTISVRMTSAKISSFYSYSIYRYPYFVGS